MGSISQHHVTKSWEVRFKSNAFKALVGGARTLNFPPHSEAEARAAEKRIEDQIARAQMPPEFQGERGTRGGDRTSTTAVTAGNPAMLTRLHAIVGEYELARRVSASDKKTLFPVDCRDGQSPPLRHDPGLGRRIVLASRTLTARPRKPAGRTFAWRHHRSANALAH